MLRATPKPPYSEPPHPNTQHPTALFPVYTTPTPDLHLHGFSLSSYTLSAPTKPPHKFSFADSQQLKHYVNSSHLNSFWLDKRRSYSVEMWFGGSGEHGHGHGPACQQAVYRVAAAITPCGTLPCGTAWNTRTSDNWRSTHAVRLRFFVFFLRR